MSYMRPTHTQTYIRVSVCETCIEIQWKKYTFAIEKFSAFVYVQKVNQNNFPDINLLCIYIGYRNLADNIIQIPFIYVLQ